MLEIILTLRCELKKIAKKATFKSPNHRELKRLENDSRSFSLRREIQSARISLLVAL